MVVSHPPSRTELARRASDLVPLLQKNALWTEDNRRLPAETIDALADAGLMRMRIPARYGGYESKMSTVVDVVSELARGDGSTSWTVAVWAISSWMVGLFPDDVQDEVFADPDVRISGILSPRAVAIPAAGGVILNGRWSFNTGAQQSQWNTNAAVLSTASGEEPIMTVIPLVDLEIIDDWYAAGLRGTGSVTMVARDLFVPDQRVLPMGPVIQGVHRSTANAGSSIYQGPFMPTVCATVSATALGLAKAARDAFFERLPGRKITYTEDADHSQAPLTHLQVGEATVKIDEAEFHAYRAARMVDDKGPDGRPWTLEERAQSRLDMSAVCQCAKEAVDILSSATGASSVYSHVPMQRIERDARALNLIALMHPDTNLELYGRILCGLPPNTSYV